MAADIRQLAGDCVACQSLANAQQKESSMPIEANRPWEKIGTDLFSWDNNDYLLTIDYFSDWWEVDRLHSTTSTAEIRALKMHFARLGIPSTVISDNGAQFTAEAFQKRTSITAQAHLDTLMQMERQKLESRQRSA